VVLYHRSGDNSVGTHGNSSLWLPEATSHRIALVFYLTQLKEKGAAMTTTPTLGLVEEPETETSTLAEL